MQQSKINQSDSHLILFDCDGTLTDSHGVIVKAMQQAFISCGLTAPSDEAVQKVIGLSLQSAIEALSQDGYNNKRITHAYREYYRQAEDSIRLYPGVIETLDDLRSRGYRMGIVTGKSKQGLIRVLEKFDLHDYFNVLRSADCCLSKPHPEMVFECMEELGNVPGNTCLVGDALFDIQMARAAGIRAYGVSFGVESADVLYKAGAYDVVDHFPALCEHFPRLNS